MSDTLTLLLFIGLIILICVLTYNIIKWKIRHKTETITAFTGGLGAGKSWLSVLKVNAIKLKQNIKIAFHNLKTLLKRKLFKKDGEYWEKCKVFSNIPIIVGWKKKQPIYAYRLTIKHLLLEEKLPERCIVFIDEIGSVANQFEFKNRNVIKTMDKFIRWFRHFTKGGFMVVNDQCSENINLVIRRRVNIVHNLANMLCIGPLMFYYERMICISEEIKTIDMRSQTNDHDNDTQSNMTLRFRFVSRKQKRLYDTYCFSDMYANVPNGVEELWDSLKCNKILTMPEDNRREYIKGKLTLYEETIK